MSDQLTGFIWAAAGRPSLLEAFDCCGRFTAEWVEYTRGINPGAEWWPRYSTPLGLARLVRRRGGLVAHFDACLLSAGLTRTETPQRGDVAIVQAPEGPTGAIMADSRVCVRVGPLGLFVGPLPVLAVWRV